MKNTGINPTYYLLQFCLGVIPVFCATRGGMKRAAIELWTLIWPH
jgi:hypothetical protein